MANGLLGSISDERREGLGGTAPRSTLQVTAVAMCHRVLRSSDEPRNAQIVRSAMVRPDEVEGSGEGSEQHHDGEQQQRRAVGR